MSKIANTVTKHLRRAGVLSVAIKITPNLYDRHEELLKKMLKEKMKCRFNRESY